MQTSVPPQPVPSGWFPEIPQTGRPVAHAVAYVLHGSGAAGAGAWPATPSQAAATTQGPQVPAWHTWFAPQPAPSASATAVSWQTGRPVTHDVAPAWHGFAGVQSALGAQAPQTPAWQV
jgi:hypothetical protein